MTDRMPDEIEIYQMDFDGDKLLAFGTPPKNSTAIGAKYIRADVSAAKIDELEARVRELEILNHENLCGYDAATLENYQLRAAQNQKMPQRVTVDDLWAGFEDWSNEDRLDPFKFLSEKYPHGLVVVEGEK